MESSYEWRLSVVMARAVYRHTSDLVEPLAARGIVLSRSQVYRLTRCPERISLQLLAVLCDIFDVRVDELIVIGSKTVR